MRSPLFLFPWYCKLVGLALVAVAIVLLVVGLNQNPAPAGLAAWLQHPEVLRAAALLIPGLFLLAFSRERVEDEFLNALRLSSLFFSLALHAVYFLIFSYTDATGALISFPALLLMDSILLVYILIFYIRKL